MLRTSIHKCSFLSAIALAIGAMVALAASVQAAVLTLDSVVRVSSIVSTPVDLTATGGMDWAYWAPNTGTVVAPLVAPTNDKLGGTAIGNLDIVGGTGLRGSATSTTDERYSFTDGSVTASGTNQSLAGLIFNGLTGTSGVGTGLKLSITGDPAQERLVTLYLGGFASTSSLNISLNGVALPITDAKTFPNTSPKQIDVYTLRFQPNSASDQLLVQYTASAVSDVTNGHVGLQAVTVAAAPEPATMALLCLGGWAVCRRRRR